MSFLNKIFKKRQQQQVTTVPKFPPDCEKSGELSVEVGISDDFKVTIRTMKELSEEQRNTIITIVKDGMKSGSEPGSIAMNVMMGLTSMM